MRYCLLFLLIVTAFTCQAQGAKMKRTQGTGVFARITCITEDHAGNLWVGTSGEGLFFYDGKKFMQYTQKEGLPANAIWSLLADVTGQVWIGTSRGLVLFDGKMFRMVPIPAPAAVFSPFRQAPTVGNPDVDEVWRMLEDRQHDIWLGCSSGVYIRSFISGKLSAFSVKGAGNPQGLTLKMIDDIREDRYGNIWLASGMPPGMEGLIRYDGQSLTAFRPGNEGWIRSLVHDSTGLAWIGTRHLGLWTYDGQQFTRRTDNPDVSMPLLLDHEGRTWFQGLEEENGYGGKGLWVYDGKTFIHYGQQDGLEPFGVWCVFEDSRHRIWVGTRNTGLYLFHNNHFIPYFAHSNPIP